MKPDDRCRATVYRRDCYRMKRGTGFRLHFNEGRCKRARGRYDLCSQHQKMEDKGGFVGRSQF